MEKMIVYKDSKIWLVREKGDLFRLPTSEEVTVSGEEYFDLTGYRAVSLEGVCETPGVDLEPVGLRESWQLLPEQDYKAAAKGAELLNWSRTMRYCSVCGSPMERATEISKRCKNLSCRKEVFPSLWPAIVVLVTRGDEALLVHARTLSRPTVQTLVAGFVETGESLEECVAREVREETSLEIEDIHYVGSQSWPFPHQLMLGFTARYKSGELRFADGELTSGGFFSKDSLPDLPTLPSLSRMIIDSWSGADKE